MKDWVDKFLDYHREKSFKETFTRFTWKFVDPNFMMTENFYDSLPTHLKIKYEIVNDQGKMIDLNENLDVLKKENQKIVKSVVERIKFDIEQLGMTSWPMENIPLKVKKQAGNRVFEGYAALVDNQESVAIEVFDNPREAEKQHQQGIKRLVGFHYKERLKRFKKIPPDLTQAVIVLSTFIDTKELMENLENVILNELIKNFSSARKESEFEKLLANSRHELPRILDHLIIQLNKVADEYQSIQSLKQSMKYINELEDDIEEQLEILLPPYEAPLFLFSALSYIPKYLQALKIRIEKYPHRFEHDQDCIGQYNRLKNKWVER